MSHVSAGIINEAEGPTVIEGFERSDPLADYNNASNGSITQNTPLDGSKSLLHDGSSYKSGLIWTTSIADLPSQGDSFAYRTRGSGSNVQAAVAFGVQDFDNYYIVILRGEGSDKFILRKVSGGSEIGLATTSTNDVPGSERFDFSVSWGSSGELTVSADSLDSSFATSSLTATDTDYPSGGIGFAAWGSPDMVYDYVRYTS